MRWIEIIGAAGIGKSTFLENQKKHRGPNKEWLTFEEGLKEIAGRHLKKRGFQKVLQIYLRQENINFKKLGITRYLISVEQEHFKNLSRYEELASAYLSWYSDRPEFSATEKMRRICLFRKVITEMCLFDHFLPDQQIIMDEGPLNFHPALDTVANFSPHFQPELVVFCHLSIDENLRRIRKREREGRLAISHRGLSDKDLELLLAETHKLFLKKREFLVKKEIPYLDIDLTEISTDLILFDLGKSS